MEKKTMPGSMRTGNEEMMRLPSVDYILRNREIVILLGGNPRYFVIKAIRETLDEIRKTMKKNLESGITVSLVPGEEEIVRLAGKKLKDYTMRGLRRVVNATGIILHTGLGRAVLPAVSVKALACMEGYVNVQADIASGKRSKRDVFVERLVCELTGAQAATIVNNNAAATLIVLNTLAEGKEVIVSRGQLIEIGGSFRLPEMMAKSGVIMREVGTTNRTHIRDYEAAISDRTGLIFRANPSNYRVQGFAHTPDIKELAALGRKYSVPVVDDLGAGALIDFNEFGFSDEPDVGKSIASGADVTMFSGDKLIGGPQAGIIIGSKNIIDKVNENPLARVLRVCKLTLCLLEEVLFLYFDKERLMRENPTFEMLSRNIDFLQKKADELVKELRAKAPSFLFSVEEDVSYMGSGSLPMEDLKSRVITVKSDSFDCNTLSAFLREREFPVFARIRNDLLVMDMRTVLPGEETEIVRAFEDAQAKALDLKTRMQ